MAAVTICSDFGAPPPKKITSVKRHTIKIHLNSDKLRVVSHINNVRFVFRLIGYKLKQYSGNKREGKMA